nr:putative methyltransferase at1g78140, chloroplastic [Quercus suber]
MSIIEKKISQRKRKIESEREREKVMAAVISNLSSVSLPSQLSNSRRCFFKPCARPRLFNKRIFAVKVHASSTAFVYTKPPTEPIVVENEVSSSKSILACPICYDSLTLIGNHVLSVESAAGSTLQCNTCKKSFYGNQTHYDMTVSSGAKDYGAPMPPSTEFFRFPLISFLYERGWRQSFSIWGGFPGPEKEFELMRDFLKPALDGNIVDASCGSGLFSRLFAQSGLFSLVIALDYSENMNLILVRADISRLPFVSSSVDAVHAGAALQCWPSPSAAVAEISRVLRPGGVFVATTYIFDGPFAFIPFLRRQRQIIAAVSGSHFFLSERELQDLCTACGLVGFTSIRNGLFVMISASKPI